MTQAIATIPGRMLPPDLTPAYQLPEDERSDLDDIRDRPKLISFDGKEGCYKDRGIEDPNASHPNEVHGLILGLTHSQVLFPARPEHANYDQEKRWAWPKWVCRNNNKRNPPQLNPELNEEQRAEAIRRGAGHNCAGCPLAKWGRDKSKPPCAAQLNLLVLQDTQEIAVVRLGGTSAGAAEQYLGSTFKRKGLIRLYSYVTSMGRVRQTDDTGNSWWKSSFTIGAKTPEDMLPDLSQLRASYMAQLEQLVEQDHEDVAQDASANGHIPQGAAPPPVPKAAGLQLDPVTGEPILEDAFDPGTIPF